MFHCARLPLVLVCLLSAAARSSAVYAPIPVEERGKLLTLYASTGVAYDSNIFGAPADERSSLIYQFSPRLVANYSAGSQTLLSASYQLSLDHFANRPGEKFLDSHVASASVRHTFSPRWEGSLSDTFQISKNPESLLPGLSTVLNTDQSYTLNQLEGRLAGNLTKRTGVELKTRTADFSYDNANLATQLDRAEWLVGVAATHTLQPELQAVAEYRHQLIRYDAEGATKDKDSDFALLGADYMLGARAALSARAGAEYRRRRGEADDTLPYVELGAKTDYGKGGYVAVGYGFSVEEVSNLETYTDMAVHRFFANVQHVLTPKLVASGSVSWEPTTLNGRAGVSPDRDETNTKAGVALLYRWRVNWTLSTTVDRDDVRSDDPGRELKRTRAAFSVRCVF